MFALLSLVWLAPAPLAPVPTPAPVDAPSIEEREAPAYEDPVDRALQVVPGGLTAEQAAARAGEVAPSVEIKQSDVDLAKASVDRAVYSAVPTLNLSASYTRLSPLTIRFGNGALVGAANPGLLGVGPCPTGTGQCVVDSTGSPVGAASFRIPVFLNQWNTNAQLTVPLSDYALRLAKGLSAAKLSRKAAENLVAAERLKVETDARLAYYQWVRSIASLAVAEDAVARAQSRANDAHAQFDAGSIARADMLRIDTLVANAENAVLQAKAMVEYAEATLATQMGEKDVSFAVGEDVLADRPRKDPGEVDVLVEEAKRKRLELKAIDQNARSLRDAAKAERAGFFPRLDAFGEAVYANPNQRIFPAQNKWRGTWAVGVRLTYSINNPLITSARRRELKAQERAVVAQVEQLERGLALEVTSAYLDLQRAESALVAAKKGKEASEAAYVATAALFQVGKATATELVVSEAERVNARLTDVNARVDLRVAETRLRYATGNMPRARK